MNYSRLITAEPWRLSIDTYAQHRTGGMWRTSPLHAFLARKLRANFLGHRKRTLILCPPGHGKSELCDLHFPAWIFDHWPHSRVNLGSYATDFAASFSAQVIASLRQSCLPHAQVDPLRSSAKDWFTVSGGRMVASGPDGQIVGKRFHQLIGDDLVKNAEEAFSPRVVDKLWQWLQYTWLPRLEPAASVVIVGHHWHDNDLYSKIIREHGDTWDVVRLSAICEDENDPLGRAIGAALWPERWPVDELQAQFRSVGSDVARAMYQQRPPSSSGRLVKPSALRYYRQAPPPALCDRLILACDTANLATATSAFCALLLLGLRGEDVYLLDEWHERMDYAACRAAIIVMYERYGFEYALIEEAATGHALLSDCGGVPTRGAAPRGSKLVRAQAQTPMFEAGHVWLPDPDAPDAPPWAESCRDELLAFPMSPLKDRMDALVHGLADLSARRVWWSGDE